MFRVARLLIAGLAFAAPALASADTPAGHWEGAIELPGQALTVKVDLAGADGAWTGTIDIPQQGAAGLKLAGVRAVGDSLCFAIDGVPGAPTFRGVRGDGGVRGDFSQNGMVFPFHLGREAVVPPARPQEPQPPYPYRSEEVAYASGDVHLAATLTLPEGDGPFPAAVLLTGSGPENRDEEIFGHKPFLVLADDLTRHGIAVLRADDRGVGGSAGSPATATTSDFADNALAGIRYLRTRPEIARDRIGLIGHSEGGLIAPLAATRAPDRVAYIVMLAGLGVPLDEVIVRQSELILRASGADSATVAHRSGDTALAMALLKAGADSVTIRARLAESARAQAAASGQPLDEAQLAAVLDAQLPELVSPWFRYGVTLDPAALLRRITCPVLALNGSLDLQVDPRQNLTAIAEALKEGGNDDATTVELPGLNHLFQTASTGVPTEYASIEETFSPEALTLIHDWILERFGSR